MSGRSVWDFNTARQAESQRAIVKSHTDRTMTMLFKHCSGNNFMGDFYAGVLYTFTTGNAILRTAFPVFLIEILHSRSATALEIHKGQLAAIFGGHIPEIYAYTTACVYSKSPHLRNEHIRNYSLQVEGISVPPL